MDGLEYMKNGKWHNGFTDDIAAGLDRGASMCFELNRTHPSMKTERQRILKDLLGSVGESCIIHSPFRCDFGSHIHIGNNFIGNFNLTILDEAPVHIGDNVFIGPNVSIYTITHALLAEQRNKGIMRAKPVKIGNNVWIGGNVVILPGVTIGDNAVIGAGSLVTKDIPTAMLAVGNPCKVIRPINNDDRITEIAGYNIENI